MQQDLEETLKTVANNIKVEKIGKLTKSMNSYEDYRISKKPY